MRKMPNFVFLRAFEAAARLQSFALAAKELHLTPSAVSHHVRELEEHFGRPLFTRLHRRVELTTEGRLFARRLSPLFDELEASCADMSQRSRIDVLVVHCAPSLAAKWLGPRLPGFFKAHPDITISLTSGAQPVDLNEAREIDVVISYGHALSRPGIDIISLGLEQILPLCSPELLASAADPRKLMACSVLIDSQLSPVTWRDWFAHNRLPLPASPRPSFDRAALAIAAAADGMGVTLESVRLASREISNGALVEVGRGQFDPMAKEIHFVSYRAGESRTHKLESFRAWILAQSSLDTVPSRD